MFKQLCKINWSRATFGTIYPVLARGTSSSLISVTVLGFTPSGRTLGIGYYIEVRYIVFRGTAQRDRV